MFFGFDIINQLVFTYRVVNMRLLLSFILILSWMYLIYPFTAYDCNNPSGIRTVNMVETETCGEFEPWIQDPSEVRVQVVKTTRKKPIQVLRC